MTRSYWTWGCLEPASILNTNLGVLRYQFCKVTLQIPHFFEQPFFMKTEDRHALYYKVRDDAS
jgi:hypothetical protein